MTKFSNQVMVADSPLEFKLMAQIIATVHQRVYVGYRTTQPHLGTIVDSGPPALIVDVPADTLYFAHRDRPDVSIAAALTLVRVVFPDKATVQIDLSEDKDCWTCTLWRVAGEVNRWKAREPCISATRGPLPLAILACLLIAMAL